jgi:hypothetical protein
MAVPRSLLAVLLVAVAACGGGESSSSSAIVATQATTAFPNTLTSSSAPTSTTTSTSSTTSTTTTTTPPETVGSILVAGDSMARSLFPPVQAALETDSTEVRLEWVIGVLLGGELAKWERIFIADRPDVVVAHFVPWESAAIQQGTVIDTSAPGWAAAYSADWVEPWIELATSADSRIVWVTPPLAADPERSAEYQAVGAVWVAAIRRHNAGLPEDDPRRIMIIDSVALSAGPDGEFVAIDWTVDPAERLFNADGLHWCPAGAARLSDELIDTLTSIGIATASGRTPDWQTSPWALDPESVRASEPNFGEGFAYPPGECPDPA